MAILVSAGISLIFRNSFKPTIIINGKKVNANWSDLINKNFKADNVITDNSFGVDSDNVVISGKMTEASRYIHSQNLKTVTIDSSMGEVSVYLDGAKAAGDEVIMNVNTSMCDVNVYIPSDWQVENNMQNSFSDVDIDHSKGTGTKLILQGRNTMGDLTVKHVKD